MSKGQEESNMMKNLFANILGSEVNIKDDFKTTQGSVFEMFIKKLEHAHVTEKSIFDEYGIELLKLTDPLWFVIENSLKLLYGEDAAEMVLWYLYDRFDENGEIVVLEDDDGKKYTIKTPNDLWGYIKFNFPQNPLQE